MMMKIDDEDEKDDLDDDDEDWWWKGGTGVTGGPAMMTNQSAPCPPKIIFFLGFRYDFTKMCGGCLHKTDIWPSNNIFGPRMVGIGGKRVVLWCYRKPAYDDDDGDNDDDGDGNCEDADNDHDDDDNDLEENESGREYRLGCCQLLPIREKTRNPVATGNTLMMMMTMTMMMMTMMLMMMMMILSTLVIPRARNIEGTTPMLPRKSGWQISGND